MLGLPLSIAALTLAVIIVVASTIGNFIFSQISKMSYQNRLLTALRHLDIAAFPITEIEPICQEIVNVIREELGYFFGGIALIDTQVNGIRRVAISDDPKLMEVIRELPIEFKKQVVPLNQTDNLLIKAMNEKKGLFAPHLRDIQRGVLSPQISDDLQETLHLKGLFVNPLVAKGGVIGVIYYATQVDQEKFTRFEFEIMDEFTREVSMVLDNVFLYQNLRETSEKLTEANKKLKDLDQLKDDFVSVASHELRTPMTAIRSYTWMALNKSDISLSEKMKKYLSRVLLSTERLINLVNDMLNVSRIEAGRIEIRPQIFDVLSLVDEVVAEVTPKASEKMVRLQVQKIMLPKVFADPDKVHQVLLNLIGNSLKFTSADGLISLEFFTDGKMVDIAIKDNGVGISEDDLPRLFKKFERLDNSYVAAATSGGTGLGLYISKSLVDLMHGRIWASSDGSGKGSTFAFSLPVASPETVAQADKFTKKVGGGAKMLEPVSI